MNLLKNFDGIKKRYDELWNLENHDRPIISVPAPRVGSAKPPVPPADVTGGWLDEEYVVKRSRFQAENTYYTAETVPAVWPNLGPDIFAAMLGASLKFTKDTSWAFPCVDDWNEFDHFTIDPANEWYRRIISLTKGLVEDAKGDYIVGLTDLHTGLDAMVALRRPEILCMDLLDDPDAVKSVSKNLLDSTKSIFNELTGLVSENNGGGSYNWMSVFCSEPWYVTSCDFSIMISPDQFEEFVVPIIEAELKVFKNSIFHLDGVGAFRHLDRLLEIDDLKGVQLVPGAGAKPLYTFVDEMRKIQQHGKLLQLSGPPKDILPACEFIRPEGVQIFAWVDSPDEADAVVKECERMFRGR